MLDQHLQYNEEQGRENLSFNQLLIFHLSTIWTSADGHKNVQFTTKVTIKSWDSPRLWNVVVLIDWKDYCVSVPLSHWSQLCGRLTFQYLNNKCCSSSTQCTGLLTNVEYFVLKFISQTGLVLSGWKHPGWKCPNLVVEIIEFRMFICVLLGAGCWVASMRTSTLAGL